MDIPVDQIKQTNILKVSNNVHESLGFRANAKSILNSNQTPLIVSVSMISKEILSVAPF